MKMAAMLIPEYVRLGGSAARVVAFISWVVRSTGTIARNPPRLTSHQGSGSRQSNERTR